MKLYGIIEKRGEVARKLRKIVEYLESQINDSDNAMIDCNLDNMEIVKELSGKICYKSYKITLFYEENEKL